MKLISMTDFVLENAKQPYVEGTKYIDLVNYAKFLKQPLKLEMFVPCDEDGNVLKEPSQEDKEWFLNQTNGDFSERYTYLFNWFLAKEKVLFEGFCINGEDENIITLEFENTWIEFYKEHEVFMYGNYALIDVEDLSNFELQLTESALKQIGL